MKDVETGRIDEEHLGEKQVTGYASQWSVARGSEIDLMVNCDGPDTYDVDVVKLICGDLAPKGPGYQEEVIETDVNGEYEGQAQQIHAGSHVVVPDADSLQSSGRWQL